MEQKKKKRVVTTPNRIIKESIRTSKSVNSLNDFQFRLFTYLITYVDDFGRGSADPELLKGLVFPRRKGVTESQIANALAALATTGIIALYDVDGESYLYFPKWGDHQRIQTKYSKFPAPPLFSDASTVTHGEPRWITESDGESPLESNPNTIQSNPEARSEYAPAGDAGAGGSAACEPRRESETKLTEEEKTRGRETVKRFAAVAKLPVTEYLQKHPAFGKYFEGVTA